MTNRSFAKTTVRPRWTTTIAVVLGVFMVSSPGVARAQLGCVIDSECDDSNICTDDACVAGICEHANNAVSCDDGLFCTQTDTCNGGLCAGVGDPCLAQGQVCDATQSTCVDTLATITIHNLYMYPGTTADLIVSGQLSGHEAYSVSVWPWIMQQSVTGLAGAGSVGFTPAPPTDIVQLGDPWLGNSAFATYDTDVMGQPDNSVNMAIIYDPSYVSGSPLFSGPLMRFPVTASNDAHGAWPVWQLDFGWSAVGTSWTIDGVITVFPENCVVDLDCDDGVFCNGAETCVVGRCQPGTLVACDDGIPCTLDMCSYSYGDACIHWPVDQRCDNGLFCDGAEACDAVLDCIPGTDPCLGQLCDESIPACVECLTDADCDDGSVCNGTELCAAGSCNPGLAVNCDDGVNCTVDSCDPIADVCMHTPFGVSCDNGLFCDGTETCDPVLDCQPGTPINCDDGIACTVDSCDEAAGSCQNTADDTQCDNGVFCDGAEVCDAATGCVAGGGPCPGQTCDEGTATCIDALTGEGFILSRHPDYSTDDREFLTSETIYMLVWTDQVAFDNLDKAEWKLKDPHKKKVKRPLTNQFDITYIAQFDLADLPSGSTEWTWKARVQDDAGNKYKPHAAITVLP